MISFVMPRLSLSSCLRWTGIVALLLSSFLQAGCEKPTSINSSSNPPADYQLPMNLLVRDNQGKPLEIQLLSRDDTSMKFRRLADDQEFTLALNRLAAEDRALVLKFPKTSLMPSDVSVAGQYIATRREAIKRLTRDVEEIRTLMATEKLTTSTIKAKRAELERKLAEISKMKDQIEEKQKTR
jgi:hypothetical protein